MAGFFKRVLCHLGFLKEDNTAKQQQPAVSNIVKPTKGFSVKMAVASEVVSQGPVVWESFTDGGVQGFRWYLQKFRVDEDGDFAEEFLEEILPDIMGPSDSREMPRLEINQSTKPAKLKNYIYSSNGNVYQSVEHGGKLHWA